jgi:hypothetical protein
MYRKREMVGPGLTGHGKAFTKGAVENFERSRRLFEDHAFQPSAFYMYG